MRERKLEEVGATIDEIRMESDSSQYVAFADPCPLCGTHKRRRALPPTSTPRKKLFVVQSSQQEPFSSPFPRTETPSPPSPSCLSYNRTVGTSYAAIMPPSLLQQTHLGSSRSSIFGRSYSAPHPMPTSSFVPKMATLFRNKSDVPYRSRSQSEESLKLKRVMEKVGDLHRQFKEMMEKSKQIQDDIHVIIQEEVTAEEERDTEH